MLRAVPVMRRVVSTPSKRYIRIVRRRLTTETTEASSVRKGNTLRNFILTTALATGTFYISSAFISYNNNTYHDFFVGKVPLGKSVVEYGEARGWDELTVGDVATAGIEAAVTTYTLVTDVLTGKITPSEVAERAKVATEKKIEDVKSPTAIKRDAAKVEQTVQQTKTQSSKGAVEVKVAEKVDATAKDVAHQTRYELDELVRRAEAAIIGKSFDSSSAAAEDATSKDSTPPTPEVLSPSPRDVYDLPLPLGFEPPPGYVRPSPPKRTPEEKSKFSEPQRELPLISPAVSNVSEPIITHLAGTIDSLASFVKSDPKAAEKAGDILEIAQGDLTSLVNRIETLKEQERTALDAKLDEQTRECTLRLLEMEMEAQDKLDAQEEGFRQAFEQERANFIQAYREKLDHELKVQTELINERLKEEVIAQGIELQRRWIREIKVRVEQERGGRLGKLDELSANLKRLERITLDNSSYLDENIRVHALWSALRSLTNSTTASSVRKPFREELRLLRHNTATREDPVVSVVLDSLEKTDVPDIGVEPFADLAIWFTNEVAPKVAQVALVPDEDAGVLSYLASRVLSGLQFKRQGLVPGSDALGVLARADYYLNEKNLDSAARELNQLNGPAKVLLHDWLEAARRRLEVEQALEIVHTQATLAALLLI